MMTDTLNAVDQAIQRHIGEIGEAQSPNPGSSSSTHKPSKQTV